MNQKVTMLNATSLDGSASKFSDNDAIENMDYIFANFSESDWAPKNGSADNAFELEWNTVLQSWRYAFQRILVPMLSIIGVVGNSITIIVLTRRSMRSSTYFYLTALAVSDLLYLLFVFSLSLKYIQGMSDVSRWLYWEYFRFAYWLSDATSSTSTWLTVAFTVERYIAVCHPMKRKIFCTQTRAKRIIVAVFILCFIATVTTPYEWKVVPNHKSGNRTLILDYSTLGANATYKKAFYWFTAVIFILVPLIFLTVFNSFLILAVRRSREQRDQLTQQSKLSGSCKVTKIRSRSCFRCRSKRPRQGDAALLQVPESGSAFSVGSEAKKPSSGSTYTKNSVSQNGARESTQENKITRMLIAVVLLAICCQMPTALMLIYTSFNEIKKGTASFYVSRILGNIFNFLTSVNAASNFILYCVMSDRFRKTFLQTFCRHWHPKRSFSTYNPSQTSRNRCIDNSGVFTSEDDNRSSLRHPSTSIHKQDYAERNFPGRITKPQEELVELDAKDLTLARSKNGHKVEGIPGSESQTPLIPPLPDLRQEKI